MGLDSTIASDTSPSAQPRIGRLMDNEALTRVTTKYMVGNLEWSGPAFQAATLFVSGIYDPFMGNGRIVVLCLAALHLLIIPVYFRGFGPLALGGWWMIIYPIQAVTVNALLAAMSQPHTYGNSILCVPGCNYSATMWLFLAYYPWLPPSLIRWRRYFEILMLGSYYAFFLVLTWLNNDGLRLLNFQSAGISLMWLLIAYVMGMAIAKMCFAAAEKQLEVQQQNFTEFFDFLHSHVKSGIASIKMGLSDVPRTREKLNELEEAVGAYRVDLLLAQEQVPLAALFSERIRTFTGVLRMIDTPRLGQLTVARPIGVLIGRALGDLLKNAANYGAAEVGIKCELIDGMIELEVSDNGPGFPPEVIDDESRSLYRLRAAARQLGGDLVMHPPVLGPGAVLKLLAPLQLTKGDQ